MNPAPVDRCVCRQVLFEELVRLRFQTGASFEELREQTGCGSGCGLCEPYIRVALNTGMTRLPVMSDPQLRALGGNAGQP